VDAVERGADVWGAWLAADAAATLDAQAAAEGAGWLLEGAPAGAGGLGAALLAESRALDEAWRRFPRREPAAAALRAAFGEDAMEAWWRSVDGSARLHAAG
jgi:hypothetical protein